VKQSDNWVIAFADSTQVAISHLSPNGECGTSATFSDADGLLHGLKMAVSESGAILAVVNSAPEHVFLIRGSRGKTERVNIAQDVRIESLRGDALFAPKWVAAGVVAAGDHYVLTIADLRSDKRVLVMIDQNAEVKTVTHVNAPFSFVAVTPDKRYLIAVRRHGVQRIETYQIVDAGHQSSS